jgi:hypothetical protein
VSEDGPLSKLLDPKLIIPLSVGVLVALLFLAYRMDSPKPPEPMDHSGHAHGEEGEDHEGDDHEGHEHP